MFCAIVALVSFPTSISCDNMGKILSVQMTIIPRPSQRHGWLRPAIGVVELSQCLIQVPYLTLLLNGYIRLFSYLLYALQLLVGDFI